MIAVALGILAAVVAFAPVLALLAFVGKELRKHR